MECRARKVGRFAVVLLTLGAWFSISNHCALGALEGRQDAAVHASCHESVPAPAKVPAKGESTPCCKTLRATLLALEKDTPAYDVSAFVVQPYVVDLVLFTDQFQAAHPIELDTGPPSSRSFAESVLQRSILAHAPPFSLS